MVLSRMMPPVTLLRVVEFSAAHRYGRAEWTRAENEAVFGPQTVLHGHNYRVEIGVHGPMNPETGFVVDLGAVDAALAAVVVGPLHNQTLNEVIPDVAAGTMQPSTEALAVWIGQALAPRIPPPAVLRFVRVWESGALGAEVAFGADALAMPETRTEEGGDA
jgi:6-pyruvoyltetrahydropterin/6-carboxytetrahydropterin synthase